MGFGECGVEWGDCFFVVMLMKGDDIDVVFYENCVFFVVNGWVCD